MQQEDLTHYLHQKGHTYPNMHLRPKLKTQQYLSAVKHNKKHLHTMETAITRR